MWNNEKRDDVCWYVRTFGKVGYVRTWDLITLNRINCYSWFIMKYIVQLTYVVTKIAQ
jgi:hypothetical protein